VCVLGGLVGKRFPSAARRIALAFGGVALIGVDMLLQDWMRSSAERAGQSVYWVSHLPAGFGFMLMIASVTSLGRAPES
jgi:hypothetical protein